MVSALATEASRLHNVDAMKREARKRRMAEARARRVETKARREAARQARAEAWAAKKQTEIVYLGEGVSKTLGQREGQAADGLPQAQDAAALARAMGIGVGELRWLAFHRRVSETTHYRRFEIPKKTGGTRRISAPMPRLKRAQQWIRTEILEHVAVHPAAHGFVRGRSIVTNAAAHTGQGVVINLDLQDFFGTLTYPRVHGLFRSLGYSPEVSTLLALVCTEAEIDTFDIDGHTWHVHATERHLPQGSPCSPVITNLVCRRLDRRLAGLASHLGFTYTRYADDLTFSSPAADAPVRRVLRAVDKIVSDEDFRIHPAKTRVMHRGRRQEVTGLVVNDGVSVPRRLLKAWRATLFQVQRDGPAGKTFGLSNDVVASLIGFAAFVRMVDRARGDRMLAAAAQLPRLAPAPSDDAVAEAAPASAEAVAPGPDPAPAPAAPDPAPTEAGGPQARWWEVWKWLS